MEYPALLLQMMKKPYERPFTKEELAECADGVMNIKRSGWEVLGESCTFSARRKLHVRLRQAHGGEDGGLERAPEGGLDTRRAREPALWRRGRSLNREGDASIREGQPRDNRAPVPCARAAASNRGLGRCGGPPSRATSYRCCDE